MFTEQISSADDHVMCLKAPEKMNMLELKSHTLVFVRFLYVIYLQRSCLPKNNTSGLDICYFVVLTEFSRVVLVQDSKERAGSHETHLEQKGQIENAQ